MESEVLIDGNVFMDAMVNTLASDQLWDEASALALKLDRKGSVIRKRMQSSPRARW